MEKKKLLFGLIEMNKTMFNILYTLLCVCVLLSIYLTFFFAMGTLANEELIPDVKFMYLFLDIAIIYFIGTKVFDKKHYA
jgi:hypothetical protein